MSSIAMKRAEEHAKYLFGLIRDAVDQRGALGAHLADIVYQLVADGLVGLAGFDTLKDLLQYTGMSHSLEWDLTTFGSLIHYCIEHHIDIECYVTPLMFGKFREALPTLRRAMREDDVVKFREVLRMVRVAPDRDTVRRLYRASRTRPPAPTLITASGYTVVVIKDGRTLKPGPDLVIALAEAIQIVNNRRSQ